MASAFFCGELGAGLFFVSMIFENAPGLVFGLLITGIGKPIFHLTHMGVPETSWRAILRPDRSWISRGMIAIVVFIGAGTLHAIDVYFSHTLPFGMVFQVLAAAAALGAMTYQGFAMSHSTAIALWNTAMMPALSLLYALMGGMVVILVLLPGSPLAGALPLALGLLLASLIMLLCMVYAAYHGSPGARLSAQLLIKGLYAKSFLGVVVAAGLLLPLALLSLGGGVMMVRLVAAASALAGFYALRVLIFKAGVYEPVMTFA